MGKCFFIWIALFGTLLSVCDSYMTVSSREKFVPENHKNWDNLDHRSCGFSFKNRIIGGHSAGLGKYPWIVRVGRSRENSIFSARRSVPVFPCAGTILNKYYVLTAAHCFLDDHAYPTLIRAGEYDSTRTKDCTPGYCAPPVQDVPIRQHYVPRHFRPITMENDLALIELAKPITFNEMVLPVCLPPHSLAKRNLTGLMSEVAGWGIVNIYSRQTASELQTVSLKVVDNVWCRMYKQKHVSYPFNILCAGNEQGKDSCSGDSGGPLMLSLNEYGTMRYYVIGVVSYGPEACGDTNSPGIYTYVAQFEQWILNLINKK